MGILYVVAAPLTDLDDLTLRARRILTEVGCVATSDLAWARRWLDSLGVEAPLVATQDHAAIWAALSSRDVALLCQELLPAPTGADLALIRAAIDHGLPVAPLPGPALPITALVMSGLPADSFVFLGELPPQPPARRTLLASVAAERRTLVAVGLSEHLGLTLADFRELLGDRPLAIVSEDASGQVWRGTVGQALEQARPGSPTERYVLVIGGAKGPATPWDEDRLRAEIAACLGQGLPAREIGRQLAAESGWPRRHIYRLALEQSRSIPGP